MSEQRPAELYLEVHRQKAFSHLPPLRRLGSYLASLVSGGYPPSVSLAVVRPEGVVLEAFGGFACVVGEMVATTAETSYDLASLTKVVATVTLSLVAQQRGGLCPDDAVRRWLPGFPQPHTTLGHLLTHTSGLVEHRPFYASEHGREAIEAAVYAEAAQARPGQAVRYSDLNFMLLGWVLEAYFG
ncbi:MAG: serine hydrolase domain-containing protein, partial [Acidimicrobiales bacterium]